MTTTTAVMHEIGHRSGSVKARTASWLRQRSMTEWVSRRHALRATGVVAGVAVAGCVGSEQGSRSRFLEFTGVEILERSADASRIQVTPKAGFLATDEEWATFHDVSIVGVDDAGRIVCRVELGDVTEGGVMESRTLECTGFPQEIRFEAEESPCEPNTSIRGLFYDKREDVWDQEELTC